MNLKVRQFQNEFMKSLSLPKYEPKIVRISALCSEGWNLDNFFLYFGRNDDFINSLKFTDLSLPLFSREIIANTNIISQKRCSCIKMWMHPDKLWHPIADRWIHGKSCSIERFNKVKSSFYDFKIEEKVGKIEGVTRGRNDCCISNPMHFKREVSVPN